MLNDTPNNAPSQNTKTTGGPILAPSPRQQKNRWFIRIFLILFIFWLIAVGSASDQPTVDPNESMGVPTNSYAAENQPYFQVNNDLTAAEFDENGGLSQNFDVVPEEDWATFSSARLGVSFRYPSEWGKARLNTTNGATGEHFQVTFTGNPQAVAVTASTDYTPVPKDAILEPITDYDSARSAARENHHLIVDDDRYTVFTAIDGFFIETGTRALVPTSSGGLVFSIAYPRPEILELTSNASQFKLDEQVLEKLYYNESDVKTLMRVANSVENL